MKVLSLTRNEPVLSARRIDEFHVHLVRSQPLRSGLSHLFALPNLCHILAPAAASRFFWSSFLSQLRRKFGLLTRAEPRQRSMTGRPYEYPALLDRIRTIRGATVAGWWIEFRKSPFFPTNEQRVDVVEEYRSRSMVLPVHTRDVAQIHAGQRCRLIGIPEHRMALRPCHRRLSRFFDRRRWRLVRGKARIQSESHILAAESRRPSVVIQDRKPLEIVS